MIQYAILTVSFLCFLYHTLIHVLGHLGKIEEGKRLYVTIGISMFLGWILYYWASFSQLRMGISLPGVSGLILVIVGFCIYFAAHKNIHKAMHKGSRKLISDGLYRHIRHPMYVGQILMLLGAPILGSAWTILALSPVFIVQILIWAFMEEKELVKEFPGYAEYRKRTWF